MSKCTNCTKYDDCRTGSGLVWPCGAYVPKNPMTNADRIRAMSDEELAAIMTATFVDEQIHYCQNRQECTDAMDRGEDIPEEKCIACLVEWSQSPAEEVTDG